MEIETSLFRGPLLASPSHIGTGESVPGLCSDDRRSIQPVPWQEAAPRALVLDPVATVSYMWVVMDSLIQVRLPEEQIHT